MVAVDSVVIFRSLIAMTSVVLAVVSLGQAEPPKESAKAYRDRILIWQKSIQADLETPEGWLSVAGLTWLNEGDNSIGCASKNRIILPTSAGTPIAGNLLLRSGTVTFQAQAGTNSKFKGKVVNQMPIQPDEDRIQTGGIIWMIIQRGKRIGVRMYDPNGRARKEFRGCKWYPVNPKYRVTAKYTEYLVPKSMPITNVLGDTQPVSNPGYVTFQIDGRECRLEAQAAGKGLFFNFRDNTSGKTTYPAGRFLDASGPVNNEVVLDFNQATNPPCAFTSFATCPLPPKENYLSVSIPAGEKTHHPAD